MTAQGRDELGVAAFIKALGGSFASYLDKSMKEWKAAFEDLPTNQVIENWAGDPEKVIMYIKRDQKALKLLKEAAKERRLELEEAFERVGKLLSGSSPKYSKLYCRATTSFVLENDFTVFCNSPEKVEGFSFSVPKTPLTPLHKEYKNTLKFSFMCGNLQSSDAEN